MTNILKELYNSGLFPSPDLTPEYKELCKKDSGLWEEVLPILGMETVDNLLDSRADLLGESNLIWFREGFRLGAALILETLYN